MHDDDIERILDEFYREDFHYESGRVLGSMYTYPPDIVLKAFFKFYQANLGNPGLYPGTARMERLVVDFLLKLTSGKAGFFGHVLSGGTEANITALWAARKMGFRKILATRDVHFSVLKAADLLGIPIEYVPMRDFAMDPRALEETVEDGTIVVATAGTTPLGYVDPIEETGKICGDLRCYLHVDAAFGGFVIPFLNELGRTNIRFGFDVQAVRSVTIDPHKMGLTPYPAGGLVARENIFAKISVEAPYLMEGRSDTLLGTRQSGSVAASYAAILHFGWDGYREIVEECIDTTDYLVFRAREEGFEILAKPVMNIVNIVVEDPRKVQRELFRRGWAVSTNPAYGTLRIVVMPHVKKEVVDEFLKELKRVYF